MDSSLIERSNKNVMRITEYLATVKGYPSFREIFSSAHGKQLGSQADDLFDFIRRIFLIAIAFDRSPAGSTIVSQALGENLTDDLDLNWLLTLAGFSLYTYLDVYSRNMIDWIDSDVTYRKKLEGYLIDYTKNRSDKSRPPVTKVKEMKRFSVENRILQIENGLLLNILNQESMESHRVNWRRFIKFRNMLAQSKSRTYWLTERNLNGT